MSWRSSTSEMLSQPCESNSAERSDSPPACPERSPVLQPPTAGTPAPMSAVPGAAFPAGRVGEPPWLVWSEPLVARGDLAGGECNPSEASAQLAGRALGGDHAGAHLPSLLAWLGDLGKGEVPGRVFQDSFGCCPFPG